MTETGWYDEETATLGDRIAAAREHAGLSAEELSERLGIRLKTLTAWEADQQEPRANRLQMLSGLLGVSLVWLITGSGDGVKAPTDRGGDAGRDAARSELARLRDDLRAAMRRIARLEKALAE